ncbi:iron-containing alcohol dehydrogenase [SAR202 cluster bacterium AC-647-N09_OGT_505m]|nr:iron-containing alcohol dehydrogenase [SAR202 cluster bacterium AC-647-N09_OGT_505m]
MGLSATFRYLSPATRLYAGVDALSHLSREVQRLEASRAFVVCSQTVAQTTNLLNRTKDTLEDLCVGVYDEAKKESPIPLVLAGVEAARAVHPDLIVAVGGGSAVVTARAITILLAEEGTVHDLCTTYPPGEAPVSPRLLEPKLPNILVLTTPTTGANRGGAAVMDDKPPYRLELFDPKARPACIILDGQALLTAPLSLYLDTSITTFMGLVGALQSPNLNPLSYSDLRQALELSLTFLPQLVAHPEDPDVRIQLGVASVLANRAADSPSGGGRGINTTLDKQIRYRYKQVGQGASRAVLLAAEMRRNREILVTGQARLAEVMGLSKEGMSDLVSAEAATQGLVDFLQSIGVPARIRDLRMPEDDLQAIAEADAAQPSFGESGHRITDVGELLQFLREAW